MSVTRANGGMDVFCLAGFLGDDNLIGHTKLLRTNPTLGRSR
jgi:hypothetical protein